MAPLLATVAAASLLLSQRVASQKQALAQMLAECRQDVAGAHSTLQATGRTAGMAVADVRAALTMLWESGDADAAVRHTRPCAGVCAVAQVSVRVPATANVAASCAERGARVLGARAEQRDRSIRQRGPSWPLRACCGQPHAVAAARGQRQCDPLERNVMGAACIRPFRCACSRCLAREYAAA